MAGSPCRHFTPPVHAFSSAVFLRQNLTQPLHLGREPVDHAPLVAGPHVAVIGVRADAVLLLGSPLKVIGQDVGFVFRHWRIPQVYRLASD